MAGSHTLSVTTDLLDLVGTALPDGFDQTFELATAMADDLVYAAPDSDVPQPP